MSSNLNPNDGLLYGGFDSFNFVTADEYPLAVKAVFKNIDKDTYTKGEIDFLIQHSTPYTKDWFFQPQSGWMWTNSDSYPYIYDNSSRNWMLFEPGHDNPRFYHYGKKEWISLD